MTHNGVELQNHNFNGQEVNTWIHNGVEIWSKAEPFYWIKDGVVQSGFPSTYTISKNPSDVWTRNLLTNFYCSMGSSSNNGSVSGYTSKVDTKGNKYMRITVGFDVAHGDGNYTINGTKITTSGTHIIDVSNVDSVVINAYLFSWAYSATGSNISEIYFYS